MSLIFGQAVVLSFTRCPHSCLELLLCCFLTRAFRAARSVSSSEHQRTQLQSTHIIPDMTCGKSVQKSERPPNHGFITPPVATAVGMFLSWLWDELLQLPLHISWSVSQTNINHRWLEHLTTLELKSHTGSNWPAHALRGAHRNANRICIYIYRERERRIQKEKE